MAEETKRIMKNMKPEDKEKIISQEKPVAEKESKKGLSEIFTAALTNFVPLAVGGLFEGSEGAVAAYKGAQQGMDFMQDRDIKERKMQLGEKQQGLQAQQANRRMDQSDRGLDIREEGLEVQRERLNDPIRLAQLQLQKDRIRQADENIDLRKEQLELLDQGENRRGSEQKFQWANRAVKSFESLGPVKEARGTLAATKNAESLISSALDNPIAAAALPTQLARLAGQVGVLTDRDVDVYGTPGSIVNKLEQIASNMATGTLTEQNAEYMRGLAEAMGTNAQNILAGEAQRVGSQFEQTLGVPKQDVQDYLLSGGGNIKQGELSDLPGPQQKQQSQPAPAPTPGSMTPAPAGDIVERNGKQYKWNPARGKYQLLR